MSRLDKYDEAAIERVVRDQQIERDRVLIERLNGCYEQEWMYHYNIAYDLARDRDYTCDEAEAYANELADKAVEELKERLEIQIRVAGTHCQFCSLSREDLFCQSCLPEPESEPEPEPEPEIDNLDLRYLLDASEQVLVEDTMIDLTSDTSSSSASVSSMSS